MAKNIVAVVMFCLGSSILLSQNCTPDTAGLSAFLTTLNLSEEAPLRFEVPNQSAKFAVLHGVIVTNTPQVVDNFIANNPNVTTLVFMQIPGSDDDDQNLIAAQKLRNRGYINYIPAVQYYPQDAFIASGGVDLFMSGVSRIIDVGAELGVHAWSNGTNEATDFPMNSPEHQPYINYYVSVGLTQQEASAFYFFTINAAPAANIYNMTEQEIVQYNLRECSNNTGCPVVDFASTSDLNQNTTIRAQNSISLSHSILANVNAFFFAANEVSFNPNAEVQSNALLEVQIANCTN